MSRLRFLFAMLSLVGTATLGLATSFGAATEAGKAKACCCGDDCQCEECGCADGTCTDCQCEACGCDGDQCTSECCNKG